MAALVDIYNLAIGRIGETSTIADPDESSVPARSCKRFYPLARDVCLEAASWPFAKRVAEPVALVDPIGVWPYAWAKPGDALVVRRMYLDDSLANECDWQELSYVGSDDATRPVLVTDDEPAWIEYTAKEYDPSKFSAMFVDALAWKLAADIAMSMARGRDLRSDALQMYQGVIQSAIAHSMKVQRKTRPDNEFIRARA